MKKIRIQINKKNFWHGNKHIPFGRKEIIDVYDNGQPINTFWKRRLEDSKSDNCIILIKPNKKVRKDKLKDNKKDKENE